MPLPSSPIRTSPGAELGWTPQRDDLDQIVADALAWERILTSKNSARRLSQTSRQGLVKARGDALWKAFATRRGGAAPRMSLWGMA